MTGQWAINAFVAALSADGRSLSYSSYLGGSSGTTGAGIALDSAWNVYVTGQTTDSDFPVTAGGFERTFAGDSDAFVAKIVIAGDLRTTVKENVTTIAKNGVVTYNAQVTNLGRMGAAMLFSPMRFQLACRMWA